ncbi:MAG: STAS domain-containing protein, partial [Nitrospiraceae bacterium]
MKQIDDFEKGGVTVVVPHGSLDIDSRKLLKDRLVSLIDVGATAILVDLSAVDYITSTGLSALLLPAMRLEKESGKFAVCSLNENITRVFEICGFSTIMNVYPSA